MYARPSTVDEPRDRPCHRGSGSLGPAPPRVPVATPRCFMLSAPSNAHEAPGSHARLASWCFAEAPPERVGASTARLAAETANVRSASRLLNVHDSFGCYHKHKFVISAAGQSLPKLRSCLPRWSHGHRRPRAAIQDGACSLHLPRHPRPHPTTRGIPSGAWWGVGGRRSPHAYTRGGPMDPCGCRRLPCRLRLKGQLIESTTLSTGRLDPPGSTGGRV